jgi:hypothetical protein
MHKPPKKGQESSLQILREPSNNDASSDRFSTPELVSPPSSRPASRTTSPFVRLAPTNGAADARKKQQSADDNDGDGSDNWNVQDYSEEEDSDIDMPSDLRPALNRHDDGRSHQPLLAAKDADPQLGYDSPLRPTPSRRSTFHERDPEGEAKYATKKRYSYAAFFLFLSLVSFAVQTETAVYIQTQLRWEKAYCML